MSNLFQDEKGMFLRREFVDAVTQLDIRHLHFIVNRFLSVLNVWVNVEYLFCVLNSKLASAIHTSAAW